MIATTTLITKLNAWKSNYTHNKLLIKEDVCTGMIATMDAAIQIAKDLEIETQTRIKNNRRFENAIVAWARRSCKGKTNER